MAEEQSSLRSAINRIIGAPAQNEITQLASKTPYSQELQTVTPGTIKTTSAISNTPFDPYAEQNAANAASLAAIKAQTDQLAAQVTPSTAAALSPQAQFAADQAQLATDKAQLASQVAASGIRKPSTGFLTDPNYVFKRPQVATARTATGRAPVQPGPNASWQVSQQYWKDLAAYKK